MKIRDERNRETRSPVETGATDASVGTARAIPGALWRPCSSALELSARSRVPPSARVTGENFHVGLHTLPRFRTENRDLRRVTFGQSGGVGNRKREVKVPRIRLEAVCNSDFCAAASGASGFALIAAIAGRTGPISIL
ncbi:hypothetical protein X777_07008 [Ooceraea biroi]|uniref:Uncharacterized protein n=1 Tax=Ooceraea biroi TaxID=2015173 RepID=A0A026WBV2_OOCBI|nr:hypothetical protein X777_07008 [Ooceraea biroi]